jgi:hypothetical protein
MPAALGSGTGAAGRSPSARSPSRPACDASIGRLHLRQVVTYEPGSRYWALQWYETAIFLAAALALAGACFVWVRRRVT